MTVLPAKGGVSSALRRRIFLAWTLWMWLAWIFSGEFKRVSSLVPLAGYFFSPPWPYFADAAKNGALALGTVLLILASSFFSGRTILGLIFGKRRLDSKTEPLPLGLADLRIIRLAAGFPVLALTVQGLGLCGLLFPCILTGLVSALSLAWAAIALLDRRRAGPPPEGGGRLHGRFIFLDLVCVLSGVLVTVATLAPEVAWDAMVYHLRVPTLYLGQHKVYPIPEIFPSYFPFSGQMLLLLAKEAGGDQGARLLHAAAWVASAFAVARIARAIWGPRAAPWAMALFMTLPAACTIAARAYVEFFLLLPTAAAVLLFVRKGNCGLPKAALAGWLAGSVLGVKYMGGFTTLVLWAVLAVRTFPRLRPTAVFWLSAAAVSGLWFLRNHLLTGNPVYPVFFGGIHWTPEDMRGWRDDASAFVFSPMTLLTTPWSLLSSRPADGGISPLIIAAAPAPILWPAATRGNRMVWLMILALFLIWWMTSPLARYLMPALALLCAAASGILAGRNVGRTAKTALEALALAGLAGSLCCCASSIHFGTEPYAAALGKITPAEYRARRFGPKGFVEALSRAEEMTGPRERVYLLGHVFSYDLPRRTWFDFFYLRPPLYWWLEGADGASRIRVRARQAGLKIIAYSKTGGIYVTGERAALMDWTPPKLEAYMGFWTRHAVKEWSAGDWEIYRLTRKPGRYPLPPGHLPGAEGITAPIDRALEFEGAASALELARRAAARYPFFPYAEERLRRLREAGTVSGASGKPSSNK